MAKDSSAGPSCLSAKRGPVAARHAPHHGRARRDAGGLCDQATQCLVAQAVAGLTIRLVLIDRRGRVVWRNRTAERVLGAVAAAAVGRPIARLLKDPQLAAFWHEAGCRTGDCLGELAVRWPESGELKWNATRCLDTAGHGPPENGDVNGDGSYPSFADINPFVALLSGG